MLNVPTVNINCGDIVSWKPILMVSIGNISLASDDNVHEKTMSIVSIARINSTVFGKPLEWFN